MMNMLLILEDCLLMLLERLMSQHFHLNDPMEEKRLMQKMPSDLFVVMFVALKKDSESKKEIIFSLFLSDQKYVDFR